jgi:hypothetical protein
MDGETKLITFEEARAIVVANRTGAEYPEGSDFQVATWGYEVDGRFYIPAGSWPQLYGYRDEDDEKYIITSNGPASSVDIETGEYFEEYSNDGSPSTPTTKAVGFMPEKSAYPADRYLD